MADKNLRVSIVLQAADKALGPLKKISQGSSETAQTLKAARDQLKQLNNQQAALGNFEKHTQAMRESSNQLKVMKQNLQVLQNTGTASASQIKKHQAAIEKQTAKFKEQQSTVFKLRNNLTSLGITNVSGAQQRLAADIAATTARIKAQTEALKKQADMQRRAAGIKQAQDANVAARGQARGALLDGVALAATLGAPIKMAVDWEQRLAELNKVANKTPQELSAIANAAQKLAVETGVAREEIIGAYIAASQAGFAESEWAQFAEVSAKMGVAFDTTGEKAGEMLKAWRAGMNLSMDQAAALAGAVNHIANSMNATALDIGGVMRRQGAYLSAMGLNQTQSAALAATMLSGGATEEIAATASKNFMKAMTVGFAATKSQLKVFEMLDVDPEQLAKQMQKAPEKAIVDVMKRLQKLAPDQLAPAMKMLFGDESIGPAAQIVKSVDGLVAAFEMVNDEAKYITSLQAEFDSMGNTTQQQMKKASESVKTVVTALGAGLLPAINQTMAAFAPVALAFYGWMQENQGLVTSVVMVVAALMALKIAAIAGAYAFTFVRGGMLSAQAAAMALRTGLPSLLGGFKALGGSAVAAGKVVPSALTAIGLALQKPVKLAIAAGKAVPGALSRMWLAAKGLPSAFVGLGKAAWEGFAKAGFAAKGAAVKVWAYVLSLKAAALASARQAAASIAMYAAMRGPKGIATDALLGLKKLTAASLRAGLGMLAGAFKGLLLPIKLVGRALLMNPIGLAVTAIAGAALLIIKFWNPIKAFFAGFWQGFVQGLAPLAPMFSATFGALGGVLSALAPLWDMLVGALSTVWSWVSQLVAPFEASKQSIEGATQAGQGFGAWLADLVVTLVSIIPKFVQFGADLVSGIINGITGKLAALKDTVVGVASSAASWFKERLGIASPSKVFTQFGGWISEGAANGIEAGQAAVRAAALAMAGAAMVPVAHAESAPPSAVPIAAIKPAAPRNTAAAPVVAGPSNYNITINAAPGMDAQAIARAVAAELDRRERQSTARRNSSLHDIS